MGTELTIRPQPMSLADLGRVLSESGFFKDSKDANKAIVKVLAGQELGIGPVSSMTGIHIIEGKPTLGANLMAAAVKRSAKYDYTVKEMGDEKCVIDFHEMLGDIWQHIGTSEFTIADAKRAGVAGHKNWRCFPKNMLFARAMSNGAKWYCPDVFGGPIYTPDELGAQVNGEGDVVDATMVVEPAAEGVTERKTVKPPSPAVKKTADWPSDDKHGVGENEPCLSTQVEAIKRSAKQVGISAQKLKALLASKGKQRLADLTIKEAGELLDKLGELELQQETSQAF